MWAQLIRARLKSGEEGELSRLNDQIYALERPGSGLIRSTAMRDQRDPAAIYMMPVFESEEKARARERDPQREEALKPARATMAEIFDGPPEFVDLEVVAEYTPGTGTADSAPVLRRLVEEVLNGRNIEALDDVMTEDFVEHEVFPGLTPNREGVKQLFAAMLAAFPDLHAEIEDAVSEGDREVVRMTWTGTQTGAFFTIPATGNSARWNVIDIVRVANGKAAEHWGVMDQLGLMQQLGLVPAPDEAMA